MTGCRAGIRAAGLARAVRQPREFLPLCNFRGSRKTRRRPRSDKANSAIAHFTRRLAMRCRRFSSGWHLRRVLLNSPGRVSSRASCAPLRRPRQSGSASGSPDPSLQAPAAAFPDIRMGRDGPGWADYSPKLTEYNQKSIDCLNDLFRVDRSRSSGRRARQIPHGSAERNRGHRPAGGAAPRAGRAAGVAHRPPVRAGGGARRCRPLTRTGSVFVRGSFINRDGSGTASLATSQGRQGSNWQLGSDIPVALLPRWRTVERLHAVS